MAPEDRQRIYDAGYKQGQEDTHAEIRAAQGTTSNGFSVGGRMVVASH